MLMLVSPILTRKDSTPLTKVLIKSEIGNTRVTEYLLWTLTGTCPSDPISEDYG